MFTPVKPVPLTAPPIFSPENTVPANQLLSNEDKLKQCLACYETDSYEVAFRKAAKIGDLYSLRMLFNNGQVNINASSPIKWVNALQIAIRYIQYPIARQKTIEFLLENGAHPEKTDKRNRNALVYLQKYVSDLTQRTHLVNLCQEAITSFNEKKKINEEFNLLEKTAIQEALEHSIADVEKEMKAINEHFSQLEKHPLTEKQKKHLSELLMERTAIQDYLENLKTTPSLVLEFENKFSRIASQIKKLKNLFKKIKSSLKLDEFESNLLKLIEAFKEINKNLSLFRKELIEFRLSSAPITFNIKSDFTTEKVNFSYFNNQATVYNMRCSFTLKPTMPTSFGKIAFVATNLGNPGPKTFRFGARDSYGKIRTVLKISTTSKYDRILLTGIEDFYHHSPLNLNREIEPSAHCVVSVAGETWDDAESDRPRGFLRVFTRHCEAGDVWYESDGITPTQCHGPMRR